MPKVLLYDALYDAGGTGGSPIERMLLAAGHEVARVTNTRALLDASRDELDAVVVDAGPADAGLRSVRTLREVVHGCACILLCETPGAGAVTDAIERGELSAVLYKPVSSARLRDALSRLIGPCGATHSYDARVRRLGEERFHLQQALDDDMLQLALQPIVEAGSSRVVAYEALLRSRHPALDGPLHVLRVAERSAMISELSERVVALAAQCMRRLPSDVRLFVNVHPIELADPPSFRARLRPLAAFARRLTIELTERSRVLDFPGWAESVASARAMGFAVAVDDLGAGYNSLSTVAELEPDFIKLDMSIVRGIDVHVRKRHIAELLCRFAALSGATLVAEGVETPAEEDILVRCGANLLQGYLYGRPRVGVPVTCPRPPTLRLAASA